MDGPAILILYGVVAQNIQPLKMIPAPSMKICREVALKNGAVEYSVGIDKESRIMFTCRPAILAGGGDEK